MIRLIASISALALAATPALAQGNGQGNNHGNNGNRSGPPAHAGQGNPGNGQGNANRGNRGNGQAQDRGNRGGPPAQARGNGNGNGANANRGGPPPQARNNGGGNGANANRGGPPAQARGNGNGNGANANRGGPRPQARGNGNGNGNGNRNGGGVSIRYDDGPDIDFRRLSSGIAQGCPPGLARKYNGCRPPGLARQQDSYRYSRYAPDWWGLGGLFGDRRGSYYYDDGFLLRIGSGGGISGYIPLLGGALAIGKTWPDDYRYARMPSYYESYYGLGGRDRYRYADNVVYRMDTETAAITSIAALLTGNDFVVGQRAPRGYDVYNVPYSYRDRYYDRPGARYRYNDGYVYEIDPETMLVVSAIQLLT